ncbi:MAG: hypothetical protein DRJ41_04315, partial [Thermoprotei archaeon]
MKEFKTSMTAIDFAAILARLQELKGLKLKNAYRIPGGLFFKFKGRGTEKGVVFGFKIGLFPVSLERIEVIEDDRFVVKLREFIRGARLVELEQVDLDRIAVFTLFKEGKRLKLYLEWIREGNLVLTDPDETILLAWEEKEMRDRKIAKGEKYMLPPRAGLDPLALSPGYYERFSKEFKARFKASAVLSKLIDAPGEVIAEALHRCKVDPQSPSTSLTLERFSCFTEKVREVIFEGIKGDRGYRLIRDGNVLGVYPFKPTHREGEFEEVDFVEALSEYFLILMYKKDEKSIKEGIERKAKEFLKRAAVLRAVADELSKEVFTLDKLLEEMRRLKEEGVRWEDIKTKISNLDPRIVEVDPGKMKVVLKLKELDVHLNANKSAYENISELFSLAKTLEKKAKKASLIAKKKKVKEKEFKVVTIKERKAWYENFYHFISSGGFLVVGGKDASQNEALVRKYMNDNDIFLHADIHGGPVVIVKSQGDSVDEKTLMEAAQLAASYSRAWELGLMSADVYWVKGSQVSKKAPSGEYLTKGAFMVYGRRSYLRNVPLEIALGVKVRNSTCEIVSGPPSAVGKETKIMVILQPGRMSRDFVIKKMVNVFKSALAK